MNRGRKPGQYTNARDANGWMIPREGTIRRAVYNAITDGLTWADIGLGRHVFNTHKQAIVSWRKVAEWRRTSEEGANA